MDTVNSYGGIKPHVRTHWSSNAAPRGAATRKKPITVSHEEVEFYTDLAINILKDVRDQHISLCERLAIGFTEQRLLKEYARDEEEIRRRVACEGLSFLTKTLPAMGKAIDIALARCAPCEITGFQQDSVTGLPSFLGPLIRMIFVPAAGKPGDKCVEMDLEAEVDNCSPPPAVVVSPIELVLENLRVLHRLKSGINEVLDDRWSSDQIRRLYGDDADMGAGRFRQPIWQRTARGTDERSFSIFRCHNSVASPEQTAFALAMIRQVCYAFYKLDLPYDEKDEAKVLSDFISVDRALPTQVDIGGHDHSEVLKMARSLISRVLSPADPLEIYPKHGPGAVATGEKTHEKATFSRFYRRLNKFYPYDQFFFYNLSHLSDEMQELCALEDLEAGTAKVVLVPKDSRGPRLISCEPLECQWIQQGQMALLVETIESSPLTKGRVNFVCQDTNRNLALRSSSHKSEWNELVTLDMKEASDRVSLALVRALFPKRWYEALYASRSDGTVLPDGTNIPLRKFAPMGSAVCFPVEALIFWALGVSVTATETGQTYSKVVSDLSGANPSIDRYSNVNLWHVYGDDIICAGEFAPEYRNVLESLSLKLNDQKCCVTGFFRESCGCDAYAGIDVTPTKFRRRWSNRYKPETLLSWVAQSNQLWDKGFLRSASQVERALSRIAQIPYISTNSATPGYVAFRRALTREEVATSNSIFRTRFNRNLQRKEIYAPVPYSPQVAGDNDGWKEMLRMQSLKGPKAFPEVDNLSDPTMQLSRAGLYSVRRRVKLKLRWMVAP